MGNVKVIIYVWLNYFLFMVGLVSLSLTIPEQSGYFNYFYFSSYFLRFLRTDWFL